MAGVGDFCEWGLKVVGEMLGEGELDVGVGVGVDNVE